MAILNLGPAQHLYYELIDGDPAKPCLVFLHEGLGSTAMWKDFPQRLCQATGCPGLVYDRLGYGRSSPLNAARSVHYLHHCALTELPQVLARLLPGQPYFLVGHSDGGSIALLHAAEQPAGLRGIVTEAAHVFVEDVTLAGIEAAHAAFAAGKLHGLAKYHGDKTEGIFKAWADTWLSSGFKHWNIEYLLPSIVCPALVLQGLDDQYGTPAQVQSIVSKALKAQPAMVAQCGHAPHHEQKEVVLQLMHTFLASQMAAPDQAIDTPISAPLA